jgi:CRP-like cAMP-binding protein
VGHHARNLQLSFKVREPTIIIFSFGKMKQEYNKNEISQSALNAIITVVTRIAPISESDMALLMPKLQCKTVKKHEFLLQEGETCRNIYFLVNGFFRMFYVDYEGNDINYRFTCEHNFLVDFQSFLLQKPSHFNWEAMQNSEILVLSFTDVHTLYAASPAWNNFGRLIAQHVYLQLNERVEMLLFMSPEERYKYLMDTRPELFSQISQFHISSYLGIKPESLSRLRKRMLKK